MYTGAKQRALTAVSFEFAAMRIDSSLGIIRVAWQAVSTTSRQ